MTFPLMTEGFLLNSWHSKEEVPEPSLLPHAPPVNRVLTTEDRLTEQKQSAFQIWGTYRSHRGESIYWLCGPNTWVVYIEYFWERAYGTQINFFKILGVLCCCLFGLFFNCKSTKHFDHCVSKFTACRGPLKFLFESKITWYCGGDLRNIMSSSHRLWSSYVLQATNNTI